ncbi:hypothetical protein GVN24_18980 [Rhizobium sp. CRIBSB]|nr:hypothetical protein [Rhizobium sp. CRIBSB]
MENWVRAVNPFSSLETVGQALAAARLSAVSLWISGGKWVLAALLMIDDLADMRAEISTAGAARGDTAIMTLVEGGLAEIMLAVVALIGLFQLVLGGVQWRIPNSTIPIIFLILSGYGLATDLWRQVTGAGNPVLWVLVLSYISLVIAVYFHALGARGAMRLEALQKGA